MAHELGKCFLIFILLTITMNRLSPPDILNTSMRIWDSQDNHSGDLPEGASKTESATDSSPDITSPTLKASTNSLRTKYFHTDLKEMSTSIYGDNFQNNYCFSQCFRDIFYQNSSNNCAEPDVNCVPCSCNKPLCLVYGTCCPSVLKPGRIKTSQFRRNITESSFSIGCDNSSLTGSTFLYVRSCPADFTIARTKSMCMEDVLSEQQTVETFTRVSDRKNMAVYYNKYCAECNNVTQVSNVCV